MTLKIPYVTLRYLAAILFLLCSIYIAFLSIHEGSREYYYNHRKIDRPELYKWYSLVVDGEYSLVVLKDYDRAIEEFTKAIRIEPNYSPAFRSRGIAWFYKKEFDTAIADYNEAIRLDPNDHFAYFYRGYGWLYKKEYHQAIADFTEQIRLDPTSSHGYAFRGEVLLLLRQSALDDFKEARRMEGRDGSLMAYTIIDGYLAARFQGDHDLAKTVLRYWKIVRYWKNPLDEQWPSPIVQFLDGDLDRAGLLALADDDEKRVGMNCVFGYLELLEGNETKAREYFTRVTEKEKVLMWGDMMAVAELDRLDNAKK
jgi:tetratricopeptide (TPR) repeat protein